MEDTSGKIKFNWKNIGIVIGTTLFGVVVIVSLSYIKLPSFSRNSDNEVLNFDDIEISEEADNNSNMQELKIEDIEVGDGVEVKEGDKLTLNYKGTLTDGTVFDSSYERGKPFNLVLGAGNVIEGWDKGLIGMKIGGKRKLTIPPELAYGEAGYGDDIPPNSTLIFEIELLEIE